MSLLKLFFCKRAERYHRKPDVLRRMPGRALYWIVYMLLLHFGMVDMLGIFLCA